MAGDHRQGCFRPVQVGFYDIERTIGRGNYAVVKLARHRVTKSEVSCEMHSTKLTSDIKHDNYGYLQSAAEQE